MINAIYKLNGKDYALGGLINGEINNMIITSPGQATIYDIKISNGTTLPLSTRYGLCLVGGTGICVTELKAGDEVVNNSGDYLYITSISTRIGADIVIPAAIFSLNSVLVTTRFEKRKLPEEVKSWTPKTKLQD